MKEISPEEISEETFREVTQSKLFQKALLYQRLEKNLNLLINQDQLYESTIESITVRHPHVDDPQITREILSLLQSEIDMHANLIDEDSSILGDIKTSSQKEESEGSVNKPETEDEVRNHLQTVLETRLDNKEMVEFAAADIAEETNMSSKQIGRIMGEWRRAEDAPFKITANDRPSAGNLWHIERK
jgi:hypothetical protein